LASFLIVYTNEVGERLHTLERYIAHYQHRFLLSFFPSNASKHQKRVVIGSTNKKSFTAKEKHSQRKYAPPESKGNAFSTQKQCNYAPISMLFPLNSNAFAHPPLNAYPQSLEPTQQSEATNRKRKYIFCRFILFFYFCIDKIKLLSEHSNRSKE
jgi:hypothetical protein